MSFSYLRFRDLKERGIAASWVQLSVMVRKYGFPPGRLLTPYQRVWTEEELAEFHASRPVVSDRPLRGEAKRRAERSRREPAAGDHA
jgi:hypothetical protein